MSALTMFQDVRHGTHVHIYSLLLPGKYRMRINVSLYINILIVTACKFKYNLKNVNWIQMEKNYVNNCITRTFLKNVFNLTSIAGSRGQPLCIKGGCMVRMTSNKLQVSIDFVNQNY